jgi:hypothetical protein
MREFDLRLGCDVCISDTDAPRTSLTDSSTGKTDYFVRVSLDLDHLCHEDRLLLRTRSKVAAENGGHLGDDRWIHIRPCPPKFRPRGPDEDEAIAICQSFTAGEQCRERMHCPFPHSHTEHRMWTLHFGRRSASGVTGGGGIGVERFVKDLGQSALRARFELEKLYRVKPGDVRFVCETCRTNGKGSAVGKSKHKPTCENGHPWQENQKLVYALEDSPTSEVIVCGPEQRKLSTNSQDELTESNKVVLECIRRLIDVNFSEKELVEESTKLRQRKQHNPSAGLPERMLQVGRRDRSEDSMSSYISSGSASESIANRRVSDSYDGFDDDDEDPAATRIREDPDEIYDDSDLEELDSGRASSDIESSDDEAYAEDPYYNIKSKTKALELLESNPDKFKRCVIELDGPFQARCRMLDEGFEVERNPEVSASNGIDTEDSSRHVIREVEIRGRANCGPCFDGDEVVVELKKTKELDGDRIIYRGTVVGVLRKSVTRKKHTFLCRVDTYHSHLMRPLDGVAPKIHVVNSIVRKRYPEKRHELVAVYKMVDKVLKLVKIVKLDPKKRRDMLFVVK